MRKPLLSLISAIPLILSSCTSAPLQPTTGIRSIIGLWNTPIGEIGFKPTSYDYENPLTTYSSRNKDAIAQLYDSQENQENNRLAFIEK